MIGASRLPHPLRLAALAAALTTAAACSDGPTRPPVEPGCTPAALQVGESIVLPAGAQCVQLTTEGSRFMVGVISASRVAGARADFTLVGRSPRGASRSLAPEPAPAEVPLVSGGADLSLPGARDPGERRARMHERVLEISRTAIARRQALRRGVAASPMAAPLEVGATQAAARTTGLKVVGDTATMHIPDITGPDACKRHFPVKVRVAHVGQRAIIAEDVTAPLAGQLDETFRSLGDEFDTVMWPILTEYFGNPLRLDAELDNNGRIVMLFSPALNQRFPGIAGFVIGCDFSPTTGDGSSNGGEVFYAMVPTSLDQTSNSSEALGGWLRTMRSTLIHEAKHITSFAERIAAGVASEEAWLEEGTARHAEELYGRALSNAAWKGNTGYSAIACEVRPSQRQCAGRPYVMFKHFDGLYDYMQANGTLTPIGKVSEDDYSYYASAWGVVRWAADLAPDEKAFFKALTRGPRSGILNLETVTGRTWEDIAANWTMALAVDDHPTATPGAQQRIASWNLRSIFNGMYSDFAEQGFYTSIYPLQPQSQAFGSFSLPGSGVRAGSGHVIELSGTWAGQQVLELQGAGGAPPASSLRLAVTRVQ